MSILKVECLFSLRWGKLVFLLGVFDLFLDCGWEEGFVFCFVFVCFVFVFCLSPLFKRGGQMNLLLKGLIVIGVGKLVFFRLVGNF